ncbi:MAG: hypothetical protein PQJ58_06215 [Spirochaetales bacterium]|nr:hypothetical protein [Spirochaetales bacterium]
MMNYRKMKPVGWGILFGIGALIFAALLALLFGWVLMLLWNWLMPEIFGLPLISYWQAWGLILLSHLLFKGGGGHGGPKGHHMHPSRMGRGGRPRQHRHLHESEDFDDFKKEFRDRMRSRWHDSDDCCGGSEGRSDDVVPEEEKE